MSFEVRSPLIVTYDPNNCWGIVAPSLKAFFTQLTPQSLGTNMKQPLTVEFAEIQQLQHYSLLTSEERADINVHIFVVDITKWPQKKKLDQELQRWLDLVVDADPWALILIHPMLLGNSPTVNPKESDRKQGFFGQMTKALNIHPTSEWEQASALMGKFVEKFSKERGPGRAAAFGGVETPNILLRLLLESYENRDKALSTKVDSVWHARHDRGWRLGEYWYVCEQLAFNHLRFGYYDEALATFSKMTQNGTSMLFALLAVMKTAPQKNHLTFAASPLSDNRKEEGSEAARACIIGTVDLVEFSSHGNLVLEGRDKAWRTFGLGFTRGNSLLVSFVAVFGSEVIMLLRTGHRRGALQLFGFFLSSIAQLLTGCGVNQAVSHFLLYSLSKSMADTVMGITPVTVDESELRPAAANWFGGEPVGPSSNSVVAATAPKDRASIITPGSTTAATGDAMSTVAVSPEDLQMRLLPPTVVHGLDLGELRITTRDLFVRLAENCGYALPSLSLMSDSIGCIKVPQTAKDEEEAGDAAGSPLDFPSTKPFKERESPRKTHQDKEFARLMSIPELQNTSAVHQQFLHLTMKAADAFVFGGRRRFDCLLMCQYVEVLLLSKPVEATNVLRQRILPHLSVLKWDPLTLYTKRALTRCLESVALYDPENFDKHAYTASCAQLISASPDSVERQHIWTSIERTADEKHPLSVAWESVFRNFSATAAYPSVFLDTVQGKGDSRHVDIDVGGSAVITVSFSSPVRLPDHTTAQLKLNSFAIEDSGDVGERFVVEDVVTITLEGGTIQWEHVSGKNQRTNHRIWNWKGTVRYLFNSCHAGLFFVSSFTLNSGHVVCECQVSQEDVDEPTMLGRSAASPKQPPALRQSPTSSQVPSQNSPTFSTSQPSCLLKVSERSTGMRVDVVPPKDVHLFHHSSKTRNSGALNLQIRVELKEPEDFYPAVSPTSKQFQKRIRTQLLSVLPELGTQQQCSQDDVFVEGTASGFSESVSDEEENPVAPSCANVDAASHSKGRDKIFVIISADLSPQVLTANLTLLESLCCGKPGEGSPTGMSTASFRSRKSICQSPARDRESAESRTSIKLPVPASNGAFIEFHLGPPQRSEECDWEVGASVIQDPFFGLRIAPSEEELQGRSVIKRGDIRLFQREKDAHQSSPSFAKTVSVSLLPSLLYSKHAEVDTSIAPDCVASPLSPNPQGASKVSLSVIAGCCETVRNNFRYAESRVVLSLTDPIDAQYSFHFIPGSTSLICTVAISNLLAEASVVITSVKLQPLKPNRKFHQENGSSSDGTEVPGFIVSSASPANDWNLGRALSAGSEDQLLFAFDLVPNPVVTVPITDVHYVRVVVDYTPSSDAQSTPRNTYYAVPGSFVCDRARPFHALLVLDGDDQIARVGTAVRFKLTLQANSQTSGPYLSLPLQLGIIPADDSWMLLGRQWQILRFPNADNDLVLRISLIPLRDGLLPLPAIELRRMAANSTETGSEALKIPVDFIQSTHSVNVVL